MGLPRRWLALDAKEEVAERLDGAMDPPSGPGSVDRELIRRALVPYKIIRSYCRVRLEGVRNLPAGGAILAANHTGWLGLDYTNLAVSIHDKTGRIVRGVVHPAWFATKRIGDLAARMGLVKASVPTMEALAKAGKLVVIFPEAEHGAFKDARQAKYQLMEFRRGFVRAAMRARKPIVPVAIVGGEEANPSLGTLKLTDKLFRIPLPIPKNILPRPVKWRISIMPPHPTDRFTPQDAEDRALVHRVCNEIRDRIAWEIQAQIEKRGHPYL